MGNVVSIFTKQDSVELNARGRKIGAHGNRPGPALRQRACAELARCAQAPMFTVSLVQVREIAELMGVSERTVLRWWSKHRSTLAAEHLMDAPNEHERDLLYRASKGSRPKRLLTKAQLQAVYSYPSAAAAKRAFDADPNHPLTGIAKSTMSDALKRIAPPVRAAVRKGKSAGRAQEAHLPRTKCLLNTRWSIDVYDLKVESGSALVPSRPKLLMIREDGPSGLPLSHVVLPSEPTAEDVLRCFGQAVIGWEADGLRVVGAPRVLLSDQGANLIARRVFTQISAVGTVLAPTASYSPSANGAHEEMHRILADYLWDLPGHQRGSTDRTGSPILPGGRTSFEDLVVLVDQAIDAMRFERPFQKGTFAGMTRADVYRQHLDAGQSVHQIATDAQIAGVAVRVGNRVHDPKEGITLDNRSFTSPELARYGGHETMEVRTLLDPSTIWVLNREGAFIGPAFDTATIDDIEAQQIYDDREERSRIAAGIHRDALDHRRERGEQAVATVTDDDRAPRWPIASDQAADSEPDADSAAEQPAPTAARRMAHRLAGGQEGQS